MSSHMKKTLHKQNSNYLLWPLAVLLFLTLGVFFSTSEVPKQQTINSRAQQAPSSPTETPTEAPTPTPVGSVINISFAIPGIASEGGNLTPLHPTRSITLAGYHKDANTLDSSIKPLFIIQTDATFDTNPISPTYGLFVRNNFDMGTIPQGQYQLGVKTDQALLKVAKKKDTDLHGILYSFDPLYTYDVSFGTLVMGDIIPVPHGNNKFDMADYSAFMECLRAQVVESPCTAKEGADFDDNGYVDEIDNNIMLLTFRSLIALGLPIPVASPTNKPSPTPTKAVTPTPAPSSGGSFVGILFIVIVVIVLAGGMIVLLKKTGVAKKLLKSGDNDKEYYIKKQSDDEKGGSWLTLADDNGQMLGHYHKKDIPDGFGRIRGTNKTKDGKSYVEISKIIWEK
jgi:hypothetical protein